MQTYELKDLLVQSMRLLRINLIQFSDEPKAHFLDGVHHADKYQKNKLLDVECLNRKNPVQLPYA